MKEDHKTWKQLMQECGIDVDADKHAADIKYSTCVVKALASVVGVPAPLDLYERRLSQIQLEPDPVDIAYKAIVQGRDFFEVWEEIQAKAMSDLLKVALAGQTDFARRLEEFSPEWVTSNVEELRNLVADDVPVVVYGVFFNEGIFSGTHAMHVAVNPDGNLVSLSDDEEVVLRVPQTNGAQIRAIVFNKK